MKAILEPISHPQLGAIVSGDGCMLPIGRFEPPFAAHACDAAAKLSRRHARIFQRGNIVYLAELGSTNGTHVNGHAVSEKSVRLMPGDEICFGGEIRYRLEVDADDTRPMVTKPDRLRLTLRPKSARVGLHTLVVTDFPFVVDKAGDVFSRYREQCSAEFVHLSRKHAVIYQTDEGLYVEDLASKNGTAIGGKLLAQEPRLLRDGDEIAFAPGSIFTYAVSISGAPSKSRTRKARARKERVNKAPNKSLPESGPAAVAPPPEAPLRGDAESCITPATDDAESPIASSTDDTESRTTFVTTAASFLDIFCHDEEADTGQAPNPQSDPAGERDIAQGEPRHVRRPGRIRRLRRMARELKGALQDDKPRSRAPLAATVGLLVVAGVVSFALYFQGAAERGLDALLNEGAYAEALQQAQSYLARHPDDADVKEIATDALFKHVVAPWQQLLSKRDFEGAAQLLADAAEQARSDKVALEGIDTLRWIGELQAFMSWRKVDDSFYIFTDAVPIRNLLERWDAAGERHRRSMFSIARHVPAFEQTQSLALSRLRLLRTQESLYVAATESLRATIVEKLGAADAIDLKPVFEAFARRYPKIDGMDRLWDDLIRYLAIDAQIQARDIDKLAVALDNAEFRTPPFRDHAANSLTRELPPDSVFKGYSESSQAWRIGQTSQALTKLEALVDAPWGDVATQRLARYRSVLQGFKALGAKPENAKYDERLLAFYGTLDPEEDAHLVAKLQGAFKSNQKQALAKAEGAFGQARALWGEYRSNGGIDGKLRLESKASSRFKKQARLLADASHHAASGRRIYEILGASSSDEWQPLDAEISGEMERQRRSLNELDMVLGHKVVEAKLELLGASVESGS